MSERKPTSIFCKIDDKHVPVYRVLWISDLPHFCGAADCVAEGRYEIRLEAEESVWANREERDSMLNAIERWHGGPGYDEGWES